MEDETMEIYLEYFTGPAAAVVVLVALAYGLYRLANEHLLPLVRTGLREHFEHIEKLMEEHSKQANSFQVLLASPEHAEDRADKPQVENAKNSWKIQKILTNQ